MPAVVQFVLSLAYAESPVPLLLKMSMVAHNASYANFSTNARNANAL